MNNNSLATKAQYIQQNSFLADAHFDLTMDICDRRDRGEKKVIENSYIKRFRNCGLNLLVSSIYIHDHFLPEMALRKALDQISYLHQEIQETPHAMALCRNADDIINAQEKGELGILLSFEGIEPLYNDINLLRIFYELGVRGLGLVWSRRNYAGDGSFFKKKKEGKKGGLSSFGVEVVEAAQELGMLIDISHLNDEGFWDVMDISRGPVIASHSNCRTLASSMRNLTDEQIHAIAETGGIIGMNTCSSFVRDDYRETRLTARELVNHVDHIVSLVGIEHVSLGFDFCDGFTDYFSKTGRTAYDVIDGHDHIVDFTVELLKRNYSEKDIEKILGDNYMRVLKKVLQ